MSRLSSVAGMSLQDALDLRTRQAQLLLDALEGLLDIIPLAVRGSLVDAAIAAVAAATDLQN